MSDQQDVFSKRYAHDDDAPFYTNDTQVYQGPPSGRRSRPWLFLFALALLVGGGIFTYTRFTASGQPSPAAADGVANFTVSNHPVIVINEAGRDIHVHSNIYAHTVTLRAVGSSGRTSNTAIPYSQSSNKKIYNFDVSSFGNDMLDLAVPSLTDLRLSSADGKITVNGVSGQMTLDAPKGSVTIDEATLEGPSYLSSGGYSELTLSNVHFQGSTTLGNSAFVTLSQDTFADTAILVVGGDLSATNTTFAGSATLTVSGNLSMANTTFAGVATLTSNGSALSMTNTTFAGAATLAASKGSLTLTGTTFHGTASLSTPGGPISIIQSTFDAGADIRSRENLDISATFGTQGSYQFTAREGEIDLTLPADLSFHLDASTNDGSIFSDFPGIHVDSNPSSAAAQAHGDVGNSGNPPKLKFTLTIDNGVVFIHQLS